MACRYESFLVRLPLETVALSIVGRHGFDANLLVSIVAVFVARVVFTLDTFN
jgi:hypothetical protein